MIYPRMSLVSGNTFDKTNCTIASGITTANIRSSDFIKTAVLTFIFMQLYNHMNHISAFTNGMNISFFCVFIETLISFFRSIYQNIVFTN